MERQCSDLSTLEDEALVSLSAGNDKDAVEAIIARYYPTVKSMADFYHSKNSFTEAEELLQEGLIGLLLAVRGYRSGKGASFKTYANTCVSRSILGKIRRDKRTFSASGEARRIVHEDIADIAAGSDNPEQIFLLKEEAAKLNNLIDTSLTLFERKTIIYFLSGYSYAQIAMKLNCSSKAVDNALQRVRRKLRT